MTVNAGSSLRPINLPQKHRQSSRKGKKAWRKNVDVADIERGLQDLNEQIIRGGVIKEKPSNELFTIDLCGDSELHGWHGKHPGRSLKADEIISQRSAVPALSTCKRADLNTTAGLVWTKRPRTNNWVPQKELARLRRVASGHGKSTLKESNAHYDIWSSATQCHQTEQPGSSARSDLPKMPKSMKQQSTCLTTNGNHIPAVHHPEGSYSYNPAFAEYDQRLVEESNRALESEKQRLAAALADQLKRDAVALSAAEAEAAEQRASLAEWEDDSEWEGFQSSTEAEKPCAKRAKQPNRKTKAQRNRVKQRKEDERQAKQRAALRKREAQEQQINLIAQEIEERERCRALAKLELSNSSKNSGDCVLRRKQLRKFKLPEKDLELVLPDELQDSLRLLRPEGNLLNDRYRNLLLRGRLESRRRVSFRKQAKRKLTEKWAFKDFLL